jgi:hypothetical protein
MDGAEVEAVEVPDGLRLAQVTLNAGPAYQRKTPETTP